MAVVKQVRAVLQDWEVVVAVINKSSNKIGIFKDAIKQLMPTLGLLEKPIELVPRLNNHFKKADASSLQSLTKAALLLPGLLATPVHAADGDEVDFQYGHYQEGNRRVYGIATDQNTGAFNMTGLPTGLKPIEVDSIHGSAKIALTDRVKFAFNYLQDTWGGATAIASTPAAFFPLTPKMDGATATSVVGASPYLQPKSNYNISGLSAVDAKGNPLMVNMSSDYSSLIYQQNNQVTDILVSASPEVRNQGDVKLAYEFDQAAVSMGGGISSERDYESRFGNVGGLLNFNQKRTTLNLGLSYTNSATHAVLPHDSFSYIDSAYYRANGQIYQNANQGGANMLQGNRQDWGTTLGLTQVLNKDALVSADVSYTRSTGYMANPYKAVSVLFIDPSINDPNSPNYIALADGVQAGNVVALSEQRPELRNQWGLGGRYVQHINPFDAAVHFDYHFSTDDWGILSHAFETDWVQPLGNNWTITPRVRYYTQSSANFYTPWLINQQAYSNAVLGENGYTLVPYDPSKLPANFSSDGRLAAFGTLSGGITISKKFAKGLTLEAGVEYYTHQGSLGLESGSANNFNNFDSWNVNSALKMNLDTLFLHGGSDNKHAGHDHESHGVHAPAGVMFDHMLPKAGDMMVGYRYMYGSQSGDTLNGSHSSTDSTMVANGCGANPCYIRSAYMSMNMHMLDLMYAPTDWLTLMLMPQFMSMSMTMNALDDAPASDEQEMIRHHLQSGHQTGGIGDLGMYGMFKLFDNGTHHIHATAGLSAPTGDVGILLNNNHGIEGGFMDYGMQLGSGTWDFKPSVTYTGKLQQFSWGVQANGTLRMQNQNTSGYALGDMYQTTAWGSYGFTHWLTGSVRGLYTSQGAIRQQYNGLINQYSPADYPTNYGGQYWDVGFGMSAMVPTGDLRGNRVSVEWLQPVQDNVNGYQLQREGTLTATWGLAF